MDVFHYNYQSAGGNRDMIKIELNYSLRAHIFEPVYRSILPETFDDGMKICMVNSMEIFVAKGNALITRAAARDLYDWCNMMSEGLFEEQCDERHLLSHLEGCSNVESNLSNWCEDIKNTLLVWEVLVM